MKKETENTPYDPDESVRGQMELDKAIEERQQALQKSARRGRLEFLLDPKLRKRLQIFSGNRRDEPDNCLFAEIHQIDTLPILEVQPTEQPIEILLKPGSNLTYRSIAKQTAEFIRAFFEEYAHLPIAIYSSIETYCLNRPATVLKFPPF